LDAELVAKITADGRKLYAFGELIDKSDEAQNDGLVYAY
jgi:hypothetical protein